MPRRFLYETNTFSPPGPALTVTVYFKRKSVTELALIDTGSDITTVTRRVVKALDLDAIGEITVLGATGVSEPRYLYSADLEFAGQRYRDHGLILLSASYMLVGRDILNEWTTTLDGTKLRFWLK